MAAEQAAAQKAADEEAAAEAKAAEEQRLAEEKAKAEAKAAEEAKAGKSEPRTRASATSKGHVVTGAAVVLRTKDKAERYLYRGAVVPDGVFTDESIKHALAVGLIEKSK
ncbi:hypothetical protein [Cellulomonas sp. ES6]|uniref:hypothetical protein n=1 Tax=Cellulomonas sp. ES6 TaxID=3039384 RepID=UPI0024B75548|nr:hypothetical protein [Cellulomonas sp. ES6]WHP18832.1 hypothetical protein P9841_06865 [Cellulomonas sp. ES6]